MNLLEAKYFPPPREETLFCFLTSSKQVMNISISLQAFRKGVEN
jgi:hypothetical protein